VCSLEFATYPGHDKQLLLLFCYQEQREADKLLLIMLLLLPQLLLAWQAWAAQKQEARAKRRRADLHARKVGDCSRTHA
jgi:hypothetical protein